MTNEHPNSTAPTSQFLIYQTEDGRTKLDVRFVDETVWLTQKLMAELFGTTPENVLIHLKNIYNEGELDPNLTAKDFLVVRQEGARQVKRTLRSRRKARARTWTPCSTLPAVPAPCC